MKGDTRTAGWNPETAERKVFDSPEERDKAGWIDHHPNDEAKGGVNAKPDEDAGKDPEMDREEIVAALKSGGVKFNESASTKQLDNALKGALRKALTAANRQSEFDKATSTRALLALVTGTPQG